MRLLILCAVFSVLLAVSYASPVKTKLHDVVADFSSSSDESFENKKNVEKNLSSQSDESDEEKENLIGNENVKIKKLDDSSSNSREHVNLVKDDAYKASSSSEEGAEVDPKLQQRTVFVVYDEDGILDLQKLTHKSKRSLNVDYVSNSYNQLKVKDEGSIKYEKYLKLKRLKRNLDSNESNDSNKVQERFVRQADTSEENSSEENKKPAPAVFVTKPEETAQTETARRRRNTDSSEENSSEEDKKAHETSNAKPAQGSETAKAETYLRSGLVEELVKAETTRRRRNINFLDDSSSTEEKESSRLTRIIEDLNSASKEENQDINEVFLFSNENQQNVKENIKTKTTENVVVVLDKSLKAEKKSDEDYAQGCGNNDDDSNENSNEDNETNLSEE